MGRRVFEGEVARLRGALAPRDLAVLDQVRALKLMSGAQIQAVQNGMAAFAEKCPQLPAADLHLIQQMRRLLIKALHKPADRR